METIKLEHGTARDVFYGRNHVFKIPKGDEGVRENGFEIELGQKSRLALDTFNLKSLGIISLDAQHLFNVQEKNELGKTNINKALINELLAYSQNMKGIIESIGSVDVGYINVQRKLNQDNKIILRKLFKLITCNGQISRLSEIINEILSLNFKGNDKIRHTLANIGNYGLTEDNEVLLLDGGISLEYNEEELLAKLDLIYNFFNDPNLITKELLNGEDMGVDELLKLLSAAA